jgi:hypothetical protein
MVIKELEATVPWEKFKFYLIMMIQILITVLMSFYIAGLILNTETDYKDEIIFIFDKSYSMQSADIVPNRLEASKKDAIKTIKKYNDFKASVYTWDESIKPLVLNSMSKSEIINIIKNIKPGYLKNNDSALEVFLSEQNLLMKNKKNDSVY